MSSSFTVIDRAGCRLIQGSVPVTEMVSLCKGMPSDAVIDSRAARILDVTFAFGTRSDLDALITQPEVVAAARERARKIGANLSEAAIEWLALGHHDRSTVAMFSTLTGVDLGGGVNPSIHPADFVRCRRLVESVPEVGSRLGEMAAVSPAWARLVGQWDELCAAMDAEAPQWRHDSNPCPESRKRIEALINEVPDACAARSSRPPLKLG